MRHAKKGLIVLSLIIILSSCFLVLTFLGGGALLPGQQACYDIPHPNNGTIPNQKNGEIKTYILKDNLESITSFYDQTLAVSQYVSEEQDSIWTKEVRDNAIVFECHSTDFTRTTSQTGCVYIVKGGSHTRIEIVMYASDLPCKRN